MFNANNTKASVAATINSLGTPIVITMASGESIKTYAVFSGDKKGSDTSDAISFTSPITISRAVCYITATKKAPSVGDELTGTNRSYSIAGVEAYRPANIIIAYKLTLE